MRRKLELINKKILSAYAKCPKCWIINTLTTPHYVCYYCDYQEKKHSRINEYERKQRKTVEGMINYLLPQEVKVKIKFLNRSPSHYIWGLTEKKSGKFTIFIPRKTFYLSNDQLTDTVAHEPSHVVNWDEIDTNHQNPEKDHGPQWYKDYRKNVKKLLSNEEFKEFINSPNPQAKFRKPYKFYPSIYEDEYNQLESKRTIAKK